MKYPIGIQNFEKIREEGFLYVDKTAWIYRLANEGSYYFLSRPRRFGKSLLISTLESYFSGKKDLFEGLAISLMEKDWKAHSILHLDLNTEKYDSAAALENKLNLALSEWEGLYGSNPNERSLSTRFEGVIRRAAEHTGKQAVILVDEYDKPMLQAIGNNALQEEYRSTLKAFYGALKSCDKYIRFAFLTGVTKFGKVSVFSDLNNLIDLSFDEDYATLCGITEEELHEYFDNSIKLLADKNKMGVTQTYERLKQYYDGYHFAYDTPGIYNPFSILNTLKKGRYGNYWFETGTPSFLVHQLQKTGYRLDEMTEENLSSDTLNSIDIMDENPLPLLYQSGYLTIKNYDERFKTYTLGFPNREVREGFIKYLVPFYTPKRENNTMFSMDKFVQEVEMGKAEDFMRRLDAFFAIGDYALMGDKELYFHNAVYVFFTLLGFYVDVERHTTNGRMDILMQTSDYVYIMELKIDKSADVALRQIEEKGYAKPFANDSRKLYKIGINFSTKKRCVDDWKIEK